MFPHVNPGAWLGKALSVHRTALRTSFYAAKYTGVPVPADAGGWDAVPPLARHELAASGFPRSAGMLTRPLEGMMVLSSGGTTAPPVHAVLTYGEWEAACEAQAMALARLGVGPRDRVVNLFAAGGQWPPFLCLGEAVRRIGAVHLPVSATPFPEELLAALRDFEATVLLTLPSTGVLLADLALKRKLALPALRLIGWSGERIGSQAATHVRRSLGAAEIRSAGYMTGEAGLLGYQCSSCAPSVYHVPTHLQYLEAVDPQTGRAVPAGTAGELLVTNLSRQAMPLVRYKIGDCGALPADACPCGDPNPLVRLDGRVGEDIRVGTVVLPVRPFEEAIVQHARLMSPNFMLELVEDETGHAIVNLSVEAAEPDTAAALDGKLRRPLVAALSGLGDGRVARMGEIRFVPLETLPRHPVTGRLRRIDDRRGATPA
jgi:phenylacetate-CoA ligase